MNLPRWTALVVLALLACVSSADARGATGPGAPLNLRVSGDALWRSQNGFELTWVNPAEQGSGISMAELRIIDLAGETADQVSLHRLGNVARIQAINLPHSGKFRAEVRLKDTSGSFGPVNEILIFYDNARPSDVSPAAARGWLSADEFPYKQEIELTEPGGPSGIRGYAVTISGRQEDRPCPSGSCLPADLSLTSGADSRTLSIDRLSEGAHWVTAVGVSGAGLASAVPGTERLLVDKTEPKSILTGEPQGWAKGSVMLEVRATDGASGMKAKPDVDDGDPVTVIRAGNGPAHVVQGDMARLKISEEGVTRVQYWARDLAGNANDGGLAQNGEVHDLPGEATVRIDRRSPVVKVVEERDPDDPELLRAFVRDGGSGLASGTIGYRELGGSGEFVGLQTAVEDNRLTARLPSDDLASGGYEIRAEAFDRAGNRGLSVDVSKSLVLDVPLKRRTDLSVRLAGKPVSTTRIQVESGRATRITGTVSGAKGGALAGLPVMVEQEFADGSPQGRVVDFTSTGATGRFSMVLQPGPSRAVQVRFAGTKVDQPALSRKLSLVARDRVRFQVNPALLVNGDTATMSGRIFGRGAPRLEGGKLMAIQYFDPARVKWRPVEVIRTDPRGRFKYRYRFRTIAYAQKILFRAVSLPEAGWPFKPTISRRRPVVVYPSR